MVKKGEVWETTPIGVAADQGYPTNDRLRVAAAVSYFKKNPNTTIVVSGGKGKLLEEAPTVASVMFSELVAWGVPSEAILLEDKSGSTFEQLKIIPSYFFGGNGENVFILSNEWHLPRIEAFIKYGPQDLNEALSKVNFLGAEEVLLSSEKEWKEVVETARKVPGLEERIEIEKRGIKAMEEGNYLFSA